MFCFSLLPQVIGATGLLVQQACAIAPAPVDYADQLLSSFIAKNRPVALRGILDNIGPGGVKVAGAAPGLVIASPSHVDPDYFFTWTRDSALTMKILIDTFTEGDQSLEPHIRDYVSSQGHLQSVDNPSGGLANGAGLGEPKFQANGTEFDGAWGRPQRDGPALRATALITYSHWLISQGKISTVLSDIWPIIRNDLAYVGQYWNQTGFDLWEEVEGSSFFTIAVQHRALVEGDVLARRIGKQCKACATQAPQILCFLQSFWNGNYILANIKENNDRSAIDANTLLGSIHTFNPHATCDDASFQPCSARALANHKVVTDSFRKIYRINSRIPEGSAVAIGRYAEDIYQGGNPWYLCTLAAAEQLYDALYQWKHMGAFTVTPTSLPFFRDFYPKIKARTYKSSGSTYKRVTRAIRKYADGYVNIVKKYSPDSGALAEQFNRDTGVPLSAVDLTWSYASFLTATDRRAGEMHISWAKSRDRSGGTSLPNTCLASSEQGSYSPPTTTTSCSPPTPTQVPSSSSSPVAVTFNVLKPTIYGQNIFLSLSTERANNNNSFSPLSPSSNSSSPSKSSSASSSPFSPFYKHHNATAQTSPPLLIPLSANTYTTSNPRWYVTVPLPAGAEVAYRYGLKEGDDGPLQLEGGEGKGGGNDDAFREYVVVEARCSSQGTGRVSLYDVWRG